MTKCLSSIQGTYRCVRPRAEVIVQRTFPNPAAPLWLEPFLYQQAASLALISPADKMRKLDLVGSRLAQPLRSWGHSAPSQLNTPGQAIALSSVSHSANGGLTRSLASHLAPKSAASVKGQTSCQAPLLSFLLWGLMPRSNPMALDCLSHRSQGKEPEFASSDAFPY